MHGCQWLKLEGLLRRSPDIHLLCLFGMTLHPYQLTDLGAFQGPPTREIRQRATGADFVTIESLVCLNMT